MEKFDEPTARLNDIKTDSEIEEKIFGAPQMLISAVAVREMRGEEPLSDTYTYFLPDGVLICKVRAGAWVRASLCECVSALMRVWMGDEGGKGDGETHTKEVSGFGNLLSV